MTSLESDPARVRDHYLTLPRKLVQNLEEELAKKAGVRIDNHTVYEIRQYGDAPTFILFDDMVAVFGRTLIEGSW